MENIERRPLTPITYLTGERGGLRFNFLAAIAYGGFGFYLTRALLAQQGSLASFAYSPLAFVVGGLGLLWGSKSKLFQFA